MAEILITIAIVAAAVAVLIYLAWSRLSGRRKGGCCGDASACAGCAQTRSGDKSCDF